MTEKASKKNRDKQAAIAPLTVKKLKILGVTDESMPKLELVFYTDQESKASALTEELRSRGYSARHSPSAGSNTLQVVNGWTDKIKMADSIVVEWTKEMCDMGYSYDCIFDGWGANPKQ